MKDNPWKLTEQEEDAVSLYVEYGDCERVGAALGLTKNAASSRIHNARVRMGLDNNVQVAIAYERWAAAGVEA